MENKRDFIQLDSWMFNLFAPKESRKGMDYIKLLIFAYIYSFSRDGNSKWYGKQQTLAKLIHCGEKAMYTKLKELTDDGYILKEEIKLYGMFHHNNYTVNWSNQEIIDCYSENTSIVPENTAIVSENIAIVQENTNNNKIDTTINTTIIKTTKKISSVTTKK